MIVHFLDYEIQSDNYSTSEIKEIFDEKNRFKRWMKIEVALSEIESDFGIIPKESVNHIKKVMENPNIDWEKVAESSWRLRHGGGHGHRRAKYAGCAACAFAGAGVDPRAARRCERRRAYRRREDRHAR